MTGRTMKRLYRAREGFSLIELLVAMLVLSTGLLGVTGLTIAVMDANLKSRNHGIATLLAQDRIEALKGLGTGSAVSTTEDYGTMPGFPDYRRVTAVRRDVPETGLSTVTVTVYWDRDASAAVLQTLLGR